MTMQTDVKAKNLTATAAASVGPCRVKSVYFVSPAGGGSVSFKNGGSSGTELIKLDAPAAALGTHVLLPGEGVWFTQDPYVTITTVTSVTFFYG